MKLPKIALIQKGRADKLSRKLIYLRYAVNGKTHWLSLGISISESNWDAKKQLVKSRDMDAAKLNQVFRTYKLEAEQVVLDLFIKNKNALVPFDLFKKTFLKNHQSSESTADQPSVSLLLETVNQIFEEKGISTSSYYAYKAAIQSFMQFNLVSLLAEITPVIVSTFHRNLIQKKNENMAAQYVRNLSVVFRHTIRRNSLKIPDPFTEKKISIKRISEKKTLAPGEYEKLTKAFNTVGLKEREILRRFFVLCKGLRFSDTVHLHQRDLQEFKQDGETLKYFNRPAQKSGIAGLIVFYNEDHLLQFDNKGFLFSKIGLKSYNNHLGKLTESIIGRPVTSHYGRHFAGDQAINSDFDIEDVKAILGISKESTARIYAQRQNTKILTKLLTYEKNKKNATDR